jgi:hypothetical protein
MALRAEAYPEMLSDPLLRAAKPAVKPLKLFDGKGLYLLVMPTGGKLWRFRYFYPPRSPEAKERLLSLDSYPEVSLKMAREGRDEARREISSGIDPAMKRKAEKESESPSNTVKAVALELFGLLRKASLAGEEPPSIAAEVVERTIQPHRTRKPRQREPISADTIDTMERRLDVHVFPYIGACKVEALTAPQVLEVLRRIESRGTYELAHRVRSIISRV